MSPSEFAGHRVQVKVYTCHNPSAVCQALGSREHYPVFPPQPHASTKFLAAQTQACPQCGAHNIDAHWASLLQTDNRFMVVTCVSCGAVLGWTMPLQIEDYEVSREAS